MRNIFIKYIMKMQHDIVQINIVFHCICCQTSVKGGSCEPPLTLVFLHSQQQERAQSAALGLATASPSPTLDNDMLAMYNEGVGDILQAT